MHLKSQLRILATLVKVHNLFTASRIFIRTNFIIRKHPRTSKLWGPKIPLLVYSYFSKEKVHVWLSPKRVWFEFKNWLRGNVFCQLVKIFVQCIVCTVALNMDFEALTKCLKESTCTLLDVRSPEDYKKRHISGAKNLHSEYLPSLYSFSRRKGI